MLLALAFQKAGEELTLTEIAGLLSKQINHWFIKALHSRLCTYIKRTRLLYGRFLWIY